MAYLGWFSFGGTEVINGPRFEAYAKNLGIPGFRPYFKFPELATALGEFPYRSPFQDVDVPWADPDNPDLYDFIGFYPTDVSGLESSSRTSTVVENTSDGGVPGRLRHATKQIVFTGILVASSDRGADAGFDWLKSALLTGALGSCIGGGCSGTQLCYLYGEPELSDADNTDCIDDYFRFLQRVQVNTGPTITSRSVLSDGSTIWGVTFTAVAGIPWEFGSVVPIVGGFPQGDYINYAGGNTVRVGYLSHEVQCPSPTWTPVFDPLCPQLVPPPTTPPVTIGCVTTPTNWLRYSFDIPDSFIRTWTDMVPLIEITSGSTTVRNVRFRIFPEGINPDIDYCGFCAEFTVSYMPLNSVMTLDGRDQTVTVYTAGQSRRADSLLFGTNGNPPDWPSLSCGSGYTVTVDTLQTATPPDIRFSLVPRSR